MDERAQAENEQAWPVVGHEWAVTLLRSSLSAGRLPHAVLFAGPAQVGKTALARALAAALNCTERMALRPCGQCRSCRLVARDLHPDVRLVQAETAARGRPGILKIDQVRELQRDAALAPMEGRHKIFILRAIDQANLPAANALLKTLEEPPRQVVLLLTSARPHALLPTVVSRCQILDLRPLPQEQVAEALQARWGATASQAALLARLSAGRLGWAVQRLTDQAAWEARAQGLATLLDLTGQGAVARLAFAEELSRSGDGLAETLDLWTSWWHDLLLTQHGCFDFVDNIDHSETLQAQAGLFAPADVRRFLQRLQAGLLQLSQNVNTRLLAENLLLSLPRPAA